MKPSQPHHAVTSYHREPGGLRRLDFFVEKITQHLGDRNPSDYKILDVGCGNGNISIPLAVMGFHVTGIDLSDAAIKFSIRAAEETGAQTTFLVGDIETIAPNKFDAIICSEVLEHQSDPRKFLEALKDRISNDGILLLSVPNGQSLEERLRRILNASSTGQNVKVWIKKLLGAQTVQSISQDVHVSFFSYKKLTELLRQTGFMVMHSDNVAVWFKEFFYIIGRAWMKRGSAIFHWLDKFDNQLAEYWPRFSADGWLVETRKYGVRSTEYGESNPLVVHLIPTLGVGGAERIILQLAEGLSKNDFEIVTIAHVQGGPMEKKFIDKKLPLIIIPRSGSYKRWKNFWTLRRALIDLKPDIVHTHLFGSDFWGRLAACFAGVRLIVTTEHNTNVEFGFIRTLALRLTKRLAVKHIAISKQVEGYLHKRLHVPSNKIELIYNGVDIDQVRSTEYAVRRSPYNVLRTPYPVRSLRDIPKFIFVGRLEEQKNPEMILRSLATIKRPWRLSMVGIGSLESRLKSLAEELKITARVDFLGLRDDVSDLLARHDFFLFPSRWEGFGLALLEAAVAGIPVIASDLPVLREILGDDQATFLPSDDVRAWASTIESALSDPTPFFVKAARASSTDWSKFSQANMIAKYAELYRKLL